MLFRSGPGALTTTCRRVQRVENPGMERSAGGSKYPWEGAARRRCAWDWAEGEMAREVVPRRIAPNWGDLRKLP